MPGEKETVILRSGDGEEFVVEKAVARKLGTVRALMEDLTDEKIPVPNVTSAELRSILRYCEEEEEEEEEAPETEDDGDAESQKAATLRAEARKARDAEFVKEIKDPQLRELTVAANYLNVSALLELLIQTAADRIKNRSVEYARRFFSVENDYTPEEEEKLRKEHAWAFENLDPDDGIELL